MAVIEIYSKSDFLKMDDFYVWKSDADGRSYEETTYRLMNDIDLEGETIESMFCRVIGQNPNGEKFHWHFISELDGNGYTVRNAVIKPTSTSIKPADSGQSYIETTTVCALFGCVGNGARIHDICLENIVPMEQISSEASLLMGLMMHSYPTVLDREIIIRNVAIKMTGTRNYEGTTLRVLNQGTWINYDSTLKLNVTNLQVHVDVDMGSTGRFLGFVKGPIHNFERVTLTGKVNGSSGENYIFTQQVNGAPSLPSTGTTSFAVLLDEYSGYPVTVTSSDRKYYMGVAVNYRTDAVYVGSWLDLPIDTGCPLSKDLNWFKKQSNWEKAWDTDGGGSGGLRWTFNQLGWQWWSNAFPQLYVIPHVPQFVSIAFTGDNPLRVGGSVRAVADYDNANSQVFVSWEQWYEGSWTKVSGDSNQYSWTFAPDKPGAYKFRCLAEPVGYPAEYSDESQVFQVFDSPVVLSFTAEPPTGALDQEVELSAIVVDNNATITGYSWKEGTSPDNLVEFSNAAAPSVVWQAADAEPREHWFELVVTYLDGTEPSTVTTGVQQLFSSSNLRLTFETFAISPLKSSIGDVRTVAWELTSNSTNGVIWLETLKNGLWTSHQQVSDTITNVGSNVLTNAELGLGQRFRLAVTAVDTTGVTARFYSDIVTLDIFELEVTSTVISPNAGLVNEKATLSVFAQTKLVEVVNYLWQKQTTGGWLNISQRETVEVGDFVVGENNYRCIVTAPEYGYSKTSQTVTFTARNPSYFIETVNLSPRTGNAFTMVKLSATVSAEAAFAVQWERNLNGQWVTIQGANSLQATATDWTQDSTEVRLKVIPAYGEPLFSNSLVFTAVPIDVRGVFTVSLRSLVENNVSCMPSDIMTSAQKERYPIIAAMLPEIDALFYNKYADMEISATGIGPWLTMYKGLLSCNLDRFDDQINLAYGPDWTVSPKSEQSMVQVYEDTPSTNPVGTYPTTRTSTTVTLDDNLNLVERYQSLNRDPVQPMCDFVDALQPLFISIYPGYLMPVVYEVRL